MPSKANRLQQALVFYVLLTVHLITVFVNNQLDAQFFFFYLFTAILYMFHATKCSSSGESVVSIRPPVCVTLCRWPCGMQVWMETCIYRRSYWYNWLSWWWALGCSKHVENWNKQIYEKELCVKLVIYKALLCLELNTQCTWLLQ